MVIFRDPSRLARDDVEASGLALSLRNAAVTLFGFSKGARIADVTHQNDRRLFQVSQWQAAVDCDVLSENMTGGKYRGAVEGKWTLGHSM